MMKFLVSAFAVLVAVNADVVKDLEQCSNGAVLPTSVDISGCSVQPCPLVKGTTAEMILTFKAPYELESFKATVRASYGLISLDFPLPNPDGCSNLISSTCPLEEGEPASYRLKMAVSKLYPSVNNLNLAFSLNDQDGKTFSCFLVKTYVKS